jgi:hypothetical protein
MAVRVDVQGQTVGHLSRELARQYRKQLERAGYGSTDAYCDARIRGGWDRGEGRRGHYGVFLDLPDGRFDHHELQANGASRTRAVGFDSS